MHQYLVEFIGTALLVFVVLYTGNYLAIGATLAIIILIGGKISGGAYNPAVAIGMGMASKIPKTAILPYCVVEILGALLALWLYKSIIKGKK
jgi:aquaporin Z